MRKVYAIRTREGILVAEHVRINHTDGTKSVSWRRPGFAPERGLAGLRTADLPLYGTERLDRLAIGEPIVLCEGEKATKAVWSLGVPALGTVTGAHGTPTEDVLSSVLAFDTVLWPDHDDEGERHMTRVAAGIVRLGGTARRLAWAGACTKGDDAADFVARGGDRVTLDLMIRGAEPWRPDCLPKPAARPRYEGLTDGRVETARSHLVEVAIEKLGQPVRQQSGGLWWRCPFHADQTPSFKVDLREPFFVCFGCGARGDVFTFLRDLDGMEFRDALRTLAPHELGGIPRLGA
ncbi:MAG: hypothetical protein IT306_21905 [Chloroflexi bacterium]|nr:hypothetical protein [Chloroflexota bacterium]